MTVSNSTHVSRLMQDMIFRQRVNVHVVGEGKYYSNFPWDEVPIITDQVLPLIAQEQDVVYAYTYGGGYDVENITDSTIQSKVGTFLPLVRPGLTRVPQA